MRAKKKEQQLGSSGSGQVSASEAKRQASGTPANQKRDGKSGATPDELAEKKEEDVKGTRADLVIYLKDFPQSAKDIEAMLRFGLERLHGVFMVEEIFNREYDSDDEEMLASQVKESTRYKTPDGDGHNQEDEKEDSPPTPAEKLYNRRRERAA